MKPGALRRYTKSPKFEHQTASIFRALKPSACSTQRSMCIIVTTVAIQHPQPSRNGALGKEQAMLTWMSKPPLGRIPLQSKQHICKTWTALQSGLGFAQTSGTRECLKHDCFSAEPRGTHATTLPTAPPTQSLSPTMPRTSAFTHAGCRQSRMVLVRVSAPTCDGLCYTSTQVYLCRQNVAFHSRVHYQTGCGNLCIS